MSLSIKSREAHELAAELARLTGESMTKAVFEALRERLERKRRERDREKLVAEAMAIARRVASYPRKDHRSHGEFLYDERGFRRHVRAAGDCSSEVCEGTATTMSLNIPSPEAHELAAELARLTGESMTKAVTEAIRERLEREKRKRDEDNLFAELMEIVDQCAAYPRRDNRSLEEFLHDQRGLPR